MQNSPATLIIPVESQVRELDAKLLLACCAAERGFPVVIGSRAFVHFVAGALPRGVYLAKSMRGLSGTMFRLLRMLGHEIVAWEEEALVHPPAPVYHTLRLAPQTVRRVSHVFAWGRENQELLKSYPHLPDELPIHVSGNPRGDMLRSELRGYFTDEVQQLLSQYGDFILVNTNFGDVNPYIPDIGLFQTAQAGKSAPLGQAGKGMPREFAQGFFHHKQAVLKDFLALMPRLEQAFPEVTIVVRPHPSEDVGIYHALSTKCRRVRVSNAGSVVPWLLACRALVHNGCTTGVEAYLLRIPAIAYLTTLSERYDYGVQGLPNRLSHQVFSHAQCEQIIQQVLRGELGAAAGKERRDLADYYLFAQDGPLASERILDVLEENGYLHDSPPVNPFPEYVLARLLTWVKAGLTRLYMNRPGLNRAAYHDHRFPELGVTDLESRVFRLANQLQRFSNIQVEQYSRHIFRVNNR